MDLNNPFFKIYIYIYIIEREGAVLGTLTYFNLTVNELRLDLEWVTIASTDRVLILSAIYTTL